MGANYVIRPDVKEFIEYSNAQDAKRQGPIDLRKMRQGSEDSRKHREVARGPLAVDSRLQIPGPGGLALSARIFDSRKGRGPGPLMLFCHGGGFVVCSADTHEAATAEIARQLDLPVFSLDYRLAPENPWPAAPDDAEAAARWLAGGPDAVKSALEAADFQPTGLVLAGDSAGANLSLVTALALREAPAPLPVLALLLFFPAVDMTMAGGSLDEFGEGFTFTRESMAFFGQAYKPQVEHWRASPLKADLRGLPPMVVNSCELDPFRDQARALAEKLSRSGGDVYLHESKGLVHAWLTCRKALPSAERDFQLLLAVLRSILQNP